jgi:hypothetical protein
LLFRPTKSDAEVKLQATRKAKIASDPVYCILSNGVEKYAYEADCVEDGGVVATAASGGDTYCLLRNADKTFSVKFVTKSECANQKGRIVSQEEAAKLNAGLPKTNTKFLSGATTQSQFINCITVNPTTSLMTINKVPQGGCQGEIVPPARLNEAVENMNTHNNAVRAKASQKK